MHLSKVGSFIFFSFLSFTIFLASSGFSYVNWNVTFSGRVLNVIALFMLYFVFMNLSNIQCAMHFSKQVKRLALLPFLSVIGGMLTTGISPISAAIGCLSHSFILFYFLFHYFGIREKPIMVLITIFCLIVLAIQVVQQFTFPIAFFGLRSLDDPAVNHVMDLVDVRNGLYRFRIVFLFAMVAIFYYWQRIQEEFRTVSMLLFILSAVSIYLFLTRQLMISVYAMIFFSMFLVRGFKAKLWILGLLGILLIGIVGYGDLLFEELMESVNDDANEDNIRVSSALYFLGGIFRNPVTIFFGNGSPDYLPTIGMNKGYWITDVGLIGEAFTYGVVYVICFYRLLFRIFRRRKQIPLYVKLFVMTSTVMSIMIFPITNWISALIWAVLLYISDLHINKSSLRYVS